MFCFWNCNFGFKHKICRIAQIPNRDIFTKSQAIDRIFAGHLNWEIFTHNFSVVQYAEVTFSIINTMWMLYLLLLCAWNANVCSHARHCPLCGRYVLHFLIKSFLKFYQRECYLRYIRLIDDEGDSSSGSEASILLDFYKFTKSIDNELLSLEALEQNKLTKGVLIIEWYVH